jgi:fimbrial isopeptide formation D2 family protein
MKTIKFFVFMLCILLVSALSAKIEGTMIGGEPHESWEDGGQDFFVMFNSNIDNKLVLFGEDPDNPQGDTCVDESTFTLDDFHVPKDTIVEKAYLVWMGAVDPSKLSDPTDNSVKLKFIQTAESSPVIYEETVTAGETGKLLSDENSFDFESLYFMDDVENGCTETAGGSIVRDQYLGYFTYRVDITSFFNKIAEMNTEAGKLEEGQFFGTYVFSDLDCTAHDYYRCKTTMVSAWAIFIVYRAQKIRPKKLYLYNGLAFVQGDKSLATVSGFELPKNPMVRLTTMIAEGDPSLVEASLPPEGIFLQGEGATSRFRLFNECNPLMGTYVEVFNSVSSIVNWDPEATEKIKCISGPDDDWVNYGIDVDTFLLDSETNINLQEHLKKGNKSMEISLSVNQDAIFTNFMVLSVDNKGANFDIPPEAADTKKSKLNFPFDREKHFCACPSTDEGKIADYYCETVNSRREFYYFVKVQNWGDEDAEDVIVTDELDKNLEYIAGTTSMATVYDAETDKYTDWTPIPDKSGGGFPLSGTGFKVSGKMRNCDQSKWTCQDTVLIRYKVKPKAGIAKNYTFQNMALIKDKKSDEAYKTNLSYPLKLKPTACEIDTTCPTATEDMCGGKKEDECDCGETAGGAACADGYACDGCRCIDDPAKTCFNSTAEFDLGKNSPLSEGSKIIIPKDNEGEKLIVGQFTLQATNCEAQFFNFDAATIHFDTSGDSKFSFKNLELIHDFDGNGVYDEGFDTILAVGEVYTNYVKFFVDPGHKKYLGKDIHYFLIRTNVDYNSEDIIQGTIFNFLIESENSIEISDQGTAMVSPNEVEFATFMLEPTGDFFIVTIGPKDPPVPAFSEINSNIPVIQLKTKATMRPNTIDKFSIKIPSAGGYVKFGEENGISEISLWIDANKDGKGDTKVAEMTKFATVSTTVTFDDFIQPISYLEGEEKYLVVNVKFNMVKVDDPMAGRIEIPNTGIKLSDDEASVVELPIRSKVFTYECKEGDPGCDIPPPPKEKECSCTTVGVDSSDNSALLISVLAVLAVLAALLLRKRNA